MPRILLVLLITFFCNVRAQKIPVYREINVCGQIGMSNKAYFNLIGQKRYVSIIENFERQFKKINRGYPDYYRLYSLNGSVNNPNMLFVSLIPKNLVTEENKNRKEYRIFGSDSTLRTFYDLKNKKIKKVYPYILNPDL